MRYHGSWKMALGPLFVSVALLVSACGDQSGTNPPTTNTPAPGATPSSSGPVTTGGELRVSLGGEPPTIDPNASSFADSITVVHQLFAGMFKFDPQGQLLADLAKDIPTTSNGGISSDGKTYTFKLKDGLKWSDGKAVTAEDFAYSIKRMLDPKLGAAYASFYYDIKGAEEYNTALGTKAAPKQADDATLTKLAGGLGVRAQDASTLVIELAQPRPTFLQLMGLWPSYPLRKDVVEKGDKWTEAGTLIGNGPYVLNEWVHQDHMTLTPNPNYHGDKSKLAKITLLMVGDANANFAAYQSGERDMVNVPAGAIRQTLANPNFKDEILRYPDLTTYGLQFNVKKAPFDNVKVRQALAKAVNRDAFVDKIFNGVGKPAVSWIPPGMPGYDPEPGKAAQGYDVAAAKQLLAEAGFADGKGLPQISFQYANVGSNPTIAEFFQGQMKDNLGIDVKLEPMESATFSKAVNNFEFQVAFLGWGADYPDPDNWLPDIFGSKGSNNHTQYSNPKFDELSDKAMNELDANKRLDLWKQAQKVMVEDAPVIFLNHRERFWLKKPYVKDIMTTGNDSSIPGHNFFTKVWVDKK